MVPMGLLLISKNIALSPEVLSAQNLSATFTASYPSAKAGQMHTAQTQMHTQRPPPCLEVVTRADSGVGLVAFSGPHQGTGPRFLFDAFGNLGKSMEKCLVIKSGLEAQI